MGERPGFYVAFLAVVETVAGGGRSRAPPVAEEARRKPSEQGSARKAPRADAARPLRTALRPPNPRRFFDKLRAGPGPLAPGPALLFGRPGGGPQGRPGRQTPPPPACPLRPFCAPIQSPYGWRRRAGEGEEGDVTPGGGGVLRAQGARKTKAWAGQKVPAHALCALCAPAAPPGRWDLPPAKRSIHQPFPLRLPTNKTSPPLPMSGGPA